MTPKEKAKELFGKYAMYLRSNLMYDEESYKDAKECALISVDEIIKALRKDLPEIGLGKGYWHSVKQEIEEL